MSQSQEARTRDDVLSVAEDLLIRHGPSGLSVRRIADALGVSRQIVYSRFAGKSDLVRALHDEGFRRLTAHFDAVPGPAGNTEHLLAMARAYRTSALASPTLYELMFGRPVSEFEPDADARAVASASFRPVIEASHAWLAARGETPTDRDSLALAVRIWAATHGAVSLELAGLLPERNPRVVDDLVTGILDTPRGRR